MIRLLTLNISSHLAGVASGATRAALTQHFALQSNAADISAKVQPVFLPLLSRFLN